MAVIRQRAAFVIPCCRRRVEIRVILNEASPAGLAGDRHPQLNALGNRIVRDCKRHRRNTTGSMEKSYSAERASSHHERFEHRLRIRLPAVQRLVASYPLSREPDGRQLTAFSCLPAPKGD